MQEHGIIFSALRLQYHTHSGERRCERGRECFNDAIPMRQESLIHPAYRKKSRGASAREEVIILLETIEIYRCDSHGRSIARHSTVETE